MRFDRFGPNDTSPEAERMMTELLRRKTPEQRLRMVFDRMEAMKAARKAAERLKKDDH